MKINKRVKIVALAIVVASNAATIGVVAFARPAHDTIHDGRYAYCDVVTDDGVTNHLAAFVRRCPDDATNERLTGD